LVMCSCELMCVHARWTEWPSSLCPSCIRLTAQSAQMSKCPPGLEAVRTHEGVDAQ
jgi:hypothetical protein